MEIEALQRSSSSRLIKRQIKKAWERGFQGVTKRLDLLVLFFMFSDSKITLWHYITLKDITHAYLSLLLNIQNMEKILVVYMLSLLLIHQKGQEIGFDDYLEDFPRWLMVLMRRMEEDGALEVFFFHVAPCSPP